ncbi:MAG: two-component system sensor histidine kinase AtoS [Bacillota bacterium]
MRLRLGFGRQLVVLMAALLVIPVVITVYMLHVISASERATIDQQKQRLARAVERLDAGLTTDFETILEQSGIPDNAPTREKVAALNRHLRGLIEEVRRAYPGSEVGFYVRSLDRIVDGSPSEFAGENFSRRRRQNFLRAVQGKTITELWGQSERGIVEIYRPLVRNGQMIGAVWATENLSQFSSRAEAVARTAYVIIGCGVLLGLGGSLLLVNRFVANVNRIKAGLQKLQSDLTQTLEAGAGEFKEITTAINDLATQLVQSRRYNEVMLATIDDGLLVVNLNGDVVIANAAAQRLLGVNPYFAGKTFREALPEHSPFSNILQETLAHGREIKDVLVPWRSNGAGSVQLLVSTAKLADEKGELMGAVLCCRDITERLKLQEEIRRQERLAALGRVVAGVAHEIRNPLTSMSCYLQLWQRNGNSSPALQTMQRELTRLDTLVEQLLDFAKPYEARPVPYDINFVIEKVLHFFTEVEQVNSTIQLDLAPDLPPAWIDPEQIERVLMNVLYNAFQAMPGGGLLEVATALGENGEAIVVRVRDTGVGIAQEHMKHLFQPFFSTKEKGTGLGLALAREIVEAHGGHIEVTSAVGKGTTVTIFLQTAKEV